MAERALPDAWTFAGWPKLAEGCRLDMKNMALDWVERERLAESPYAENIQLPKLSEEP